MKKLNLNWKQMVEENPVKSKESCFRQKEQSHAKALIKEGASQVLRTERPLWL